MMRPEIKRWTDDEDAILRQEALAGSTVIDIATILKRSESAVRTRAYVLGILLRAVGIRRRGSTWQSVGTADKG
jgi:hypothetical protein